MIRILRKITEIYFAGKRKGVKLLMVDLYQIEKYLIFKFLISLEMKMWKILIFQTMKKIILRKVLYLFQNYIKHIF